MEIVHQSRSIKTSSRGNFFTEDNKKYITHLFFYKLIATQKPLYLFNLIHPKLSSLSHPNTYSVMKCRGNYFEDSFVSYVVRE